MAKVVAPLALLVLVLSIAKTSGECGVSCTNFFQNCSIPTDIYQCICVPFGGAFGSCIYQEGLIKDNLSYCSSHSDCVRKGQGDRCIKASGTDFGWCLSHDDASSLKLPA